MSYKVVGDGEVSEYFQVTCGCCIGASRRGIDHCAPPAGHRSTFIPTPLFLVPGVRNTAAVSSRVPDPLQLEFGQSVSLLKYKPVPCVLQLRGPAREMCCRRHTSIEKGRSGWLPLLGSGTLLKMRLCRNCCQVAMCSQPPRGARGGVNGGCMASGGCVAR